MQCSWLKIKKLLMKNRPRQLIQPYVFFLLEEAIDTVEWGLNEKLI